MRAQLSAATIRPWRATDADSLASHANSRRVWLNLRDGFPHPYSIANAHSFLATAPDTFWCIAVDDAAVGGIGLSCKEDVERFSAELGYWLGERFWGKGIMTEAISAVTEHALTDLKLHRVFALPYANNPASRRVLEKCNYACEGRLRGSSFKAGKFVDQLLFARLRGDARPPIRHVLTILAVPDLESATAFYDAALGWRHAVDTPTYVEMSHPSGQRLGLYERNGFAKNTGVLPSEVPQESVSSVELYFNSSDLDHDIRRLQAAGAKLLSPLSMREWGEEAAYFRDPIGHVLVIAC